MPNKQYIAHNCLLPFYQANQLQRDYDFNLCFSYLLSSGNDIDFFIEKTQRLIDSRPHLKQTFTLKHNKLVACIHQTLPAQVNRLSCSKSKSTEIIQMLCNQNHNVAKESSIKLSVIEIIDTKSEYIVLFNINHMVMDGYSLNEFINDLNQLLQNESINQTNVNDYMALLKKEKPLKIANKSGNILRYIRRVEELYEKTQYKNKLTSKITNSTKILPVEIYEQLKIKNNESNESIFNLLLAAWSIFIAKINNQRCSIVNYPVDFRKQKNLQGCFVNTITLPFEFLENDSFSSFLANWKSQKKWFKKLKQFQFNFKQDLSSNFAYSNFAKPNDLILNNYLVSATSFSQIAGALLSIKYREYKGSLFFSIDMPSNFLPMHTGESLLSRYFNFLSKLLHNSDELVTNIDLTFDEEKKYLLNKFSKYSNIDALGKKTLLDLFEEQVKKKPNRTALVFGTLHLTYKQLNEKANQLANYLVKSYRIKPDDLIALLLDRNEQIIICILAIWKSGGAYVPIDADYPIERIGYILGDTQAKVLLLNNRLKNKLNKLINQQLNYEIIDVDNQKTHEIINQESKKNIINACSSLNLAYVIYTSGTTGNPKGVMIEHRSVINILNYLIKYVYKKPRGHREPLKITAFTSYSFDVSVSEFFVPLLSGNELHILNNEQRKDIKSTSEYIKNKRINYLYLPPILLANLPKIPHPSLIGIIYAGEPCDKQTASYWSQHTNLYNYYGPTETTIYTTGLKINNNEVELIGVPVQNTTAYILDIYKNLQPPGIIGELYIGGIGLAKGYLNRKELTKEKFILNKFQLEEEKNMGLNTHVYSTGDLVRWASNGNIEYIGRDDSQIKIRGHRIELKEIGAIVLKYPGIKNVFVTSVDHSYEENIAITDEHLVCYYISDVFIQRSLLEEYLSLHLPDFMIPNIFIHLTYLPVTPTGKLDKNALPTPDFENSDNYSPPSNEKEKIVCDAFSVILSVKKISIYDSFFKIGGNSIKAISLATELQKNFDVNISDIYLLKSPFKIAENTPLIKDNLTKNLAKIKNIYKKNNRALSAFEKGFFLQNYMYNINKLKIKTNLLPIKNVLLTGATGFLGCNLLNTLLFSTNYNIYLIIRSSTNKKAFERIQKKFNYYFNICLKQFLGIRLFVFSGNLEANKLGLSSKDYSFFSTKIDSIIHSAALTRHYGDYETFYSANVQATINLLELSKLTNLKNFHYISTISVLNNDAFSDHGCYAFTEDDAGERLNEHNNVYVKTKYEAENILLKYRDYGINGNIYRVGNLAFVLKTESGQENIEENAFFFRMKSLIHFGVICPEIAMEEISPADLTAEIIVKLFDKEVSKNQTFHVFNPNLYNIKDILCKKNNFNVKNTTVDNFFETIVAKFNDTESKKEIERYFLHMGWLGEISDKKHIEIMQNRTESILKALGFTWPIIRKESISNYILRELEHEKRR